MQRLSKHKKKMIYRMFACGESVERVAETHDITLKRAENQYRKYLDLPLAEKLRVTLLPESIINRAHRLADDIKDINRIDAMILTADVKTLVALLDMKRKIKERMMKDSASPCEASPTNDDAEIDDELLAECYERVMGGESVTAAEHG